jgi:hypothetical protein
MQVVKVPLVEDIFFNIQFKKFILSKINSLYVEYNEIPNELIFKGALGRRLFNLINDNSWKFGKTKIFHEKGPNEIEIKYTRNITVKKNSDLASHVKSSLDGKIVDGWMNSKSQSSIVNSNIDTNFNIEKTVTPNLIIKLEKLV